jgi:hypothetical protein
MIRGTLIRSTRIVTASLDTLSPIPWREKAFMRTENAECTCFLSRVMRKMDLVPFFLSEI